MIFRKWYFCSFLLLSVLVLSFPQYAKSSALPVDIPFDRDSTLKVDLSDGVITGASVKKGTAANDSYNAANDDYIKQGTVKVSYNNYTKTETGKTTVSDKGGFSLTGKIVAANAFANLASAAKQIVGSPAVTEAAAAAVEAATAGDAAAAAAHAGGAAATAAAELLFPSSVQKIVSDSVNSTSKNLWEEKKRKEEEKEGVNFIWGYVRMLPDGSYSDRIYVFSKYDGNFSDLSTIGSGDQVGFRNDKTGWSSMVSNSERNISGVGIVASGKEQVQDFFKNNPDLFADKDVKEELLKNIDKNLQALSNNVSELKNIIAESVASDALPSSVTLSEPVTAPLSDGASLTVTPLSGNRASVSSVPGSKASDEAKNAAAESAKEEESLAGDEKAEQGGLDLCKAFPVFCDTSVEEPKGLDTVQAELQTFDTGISVSCPEDFHYSVNLVYYRFDVLIPVGEYCEKTKMIKPLILFLAFLIATRIYSKWVS